MGAALLVELGEETDEVLVAGRTAGDVGVGAGVALKGTIVVLKLVGAVVMADISDVVRDTKLAVDVTGVVVTRSVVAVVSVIVSEVAVMVSEVATREVLQNSIMVSGLFGFGTTLANILCGTRICRGGSYVCRRCHNVRRRLHVCRRCHSVRRRLHACRRCHSVRRCLHICRCHCPVNRYRHSDCALCIGTMGSKHESGYCEESKFH